MIKQLYFKDAYKLVERSGSTYVIRWGYVPLLDENGCETDCGYWSEESFDVKPLFGKVKSTILESINKEVENEIQNGFRYEITSEGDEKEYVTPYLSKENQFNYMSAYEIAVQTRGKNLPVKVKYGDIDNTKYYSIETLDELKKFYSEMIGHIQSSIHSGWEKKDSIDWEEYEKALNEIE